MSTENLPELSPRLATYLHNYQFEPILLGRSSAAVYRLIHPQQATLFLKLGAAGTLVAEARRLGWLAGRLPVPEVHHFIQTPTHDYLLLSAIPGVEASDPSQAADLPAMIRGLAAGLRLLHALPIDDCPFDETFPSKLARVHQRVAAGLINTDDFDEERQGKDVEELLAELLAKAPAQEDLVFTHGDYCLPNILLQGDQLCGFIDLGRAGVGDRYQDLALAARSLAYNFGAEWVPHLFAAYEIEPDEAKIHFYQLLDEFF